MSKLKGKLARRIMAIVLSGAMVMSNMSAYAAELSTETTTETVSEVEETAAAETQENSDNEKPEAESPAAESSESTTDKVGAEEVKSEAATSEEATETKTEEASTESKTEAETEKNSATETEEASVTETASVEETETETETTEEETTEEKTDKQETVKADDGSIVFDPTTLSEAGSALTESDLTAEQKAVIGITGSITKKKASSSSATDVDSVELKKDGTASFDITIKGTGTITVSVFSTGSTKESSYALLKNGTVINTDGTEGSAYSTASKGLKDAQEVTYNNLSAGTYNLACNPTSANGLRVSKMTIKDVESSGGDSGDDQDKDTPIVYELKASEVTTGVITTKAGTDEKFTVAGKNATTNITLGNDTSDPTFVLGGETIYTGQGIKWGGSPSLADDGTVYASVGFTVPSGYMAEIVAGVGASKNAAVGLYGKSKDDAGKDKLAVLNYQAYGAKTATVAEFSGIGAGTYYIGNVKKDSNGADIQYGGAKVDGNTMLHYLRVTLSKVQPVAWADVPNINIDSAAVKEDKIVVSLSGAVINADTGCETINVTMYSDEACTQEVETVKAAGGALNLTDKKATATFTPKASGTFYFKAEGSRSKEESKKTSNVSNGVPFVLALATPVIASAENLGSGAVKISWGAVPEATSYKLIGYSDKACTTAVVEATAAATEGEEMASHTFTNELTVGKMYYFKVAAIRGDGEGDNISEYSAFIRIRVTENADTQKYNVDVAGEDGTGLKAGKTYGDPSLMTFEVLEDMTKKTGGVVGGVNYPMSVQGANNPREEDGKTTPKGTIPASGAVVKMKAADTVKVTFITGSADKIYHFIKVDENNEVVDDKTDVRVPEGSLAFVAEKGYTYYFYLEGSKVKLFDIQYRLHFAIDKIAWNEVEPPVITDVKLSSDKKQIDVTVDAVIGPDGADALNIEMFDSEGKSCGTATSTSEKDLTTIGLSPKKSDSYTFVASLTRETEIDENGVETDFEPKESAKTEPFAFLLPLSAPAMSSVTNLGEGKVEVDWVAANEATGYVVSVYEDEECKKLFKEVSVNSEFAEDGTTVTKAAETSVEMDGFTVGNTYYFRVLATRGKDMKDKSEPCDPYKKEITAEKQNKWAFAAYGSSTSITSTTTDRNGKTVPKNGFSGDFFDGEVTVWSMGGAGKIVPNTIDGLAFYYTEIDPKTTNFTLSATAHVNEWVLSNGQDGFGLMASDQVGENGNGDYLWTNSYQAVVSKIEYNWDGEAVTTDTTYPKVAMKIGVGATEKIGATKEDVDKIMAGDADKPAVWSATQSALDTTFAKYARAGGTVTCNMVGNAGAWDSKQKKFVENMPPTDAVGAETYVDFKLTLQKNNTGYFLSYEMPNGETMTKKYYDTEALNHIIEDKVYVGFFAARNANVTFKDISFTTISPEEDAPAEPRPTTYIALSKQVVSSSVTNSSDYDFVFTSNWDGVLEVRDSNNALLGKSDVTGSLDTEKAKLQSGNMEKDTKVTIPIKGLEVGKNVFNVTYTPNKKMKNPPIATELKDYSPVTFVHTVEYRKYGEEGEKIYVSPDGKASATGTKEDRLDVYTAMKYAQPGQTILLAGGTYNLYKTIGTERGVDGKPGDGYKNYIKMIAEEPANRPVFDFGGRYTGMTLSGSYWYFKGFDVTNSKDAQKGIQVSGKYNVLDQVNSYKNGNTGIQVSGSGNDTYDYWPQGNLILNCTSFLNADHGYEDADGFAAKLTIGSGNVFDGCIAAYNADDGWDLFAKIESGQIGSVTIKNCVAYKNGYVLVNDKNELDLEGTQKNAGNGNGFKMGGDGLPGGSIYDDDYDAVNKVYSGHKLYNSVAFANKSKGFDSNSCSNNKVYNSISFNNEGSNVALYTYSNVQTTGYKTENVISYRTKNRGVADEISAKNQNAADYTNSTTYLWDTKEKAGVNADGNKVGADWFKSTTFKGTNTIYPDKNHVLLGRNSDGTINMDGFLELTEAAGKDNVGLGGKPSADDEKDLIGDSSDTSGDISGGDNVDDGNESIAIDREKEFVNNMATKDGKLGLIVTGFGEFGNNEANEWTEYPYVYTGKAVVPEDFRVYMNGSSFADYKVSFKNNVNAYVDGDDRYKDIPDEKRPTMILTLKGAYQGTYEYFFNILPVDITDDEDVKVSGLSVVADGKKKTFNPTLINKATGTKLAVKRDYVITAKDYTKEGDYDVVIDATKGTSRNYTGKLETQFRLISQKDAKDISKAAIKLSETSFAYTGNAIEPKVTGYQTDKLDIAYINNINAGKASVVITGIPEEGTAGSKVLNFTIRKAALKNASIKVDGGVKDKPYTGAARVQGAVTVSLRNGEALSGIKKGSKDVNKKDGNGNYLYDYTYEYKANVEAGNATLVLKGIHNCSGTVSYRYKITPARVSKAEIRKGYDFENSGLEVGYNDVEFAPSGAKPNIVVKYNGNTVNKKNYSISYKNNKKTGTASAIISWRNSLKGASKTTIQYNIKACSFDNVVLKSVSDVFTNGKPTIQLSALNKSNIVLTSNNQKLTKNHDYTLVYTYGEEEEPDTQVGPYDASTKTQIKVPKTGLYVTAYARPIGNNYKFSDDATEDEKKNGVEVARFRIAYYNIAQAKIKAVNPVTKKVTQIYYDDAVDTSKVRNKLYNETLYKAGKDTHCNYYIVLSHSKLGRNLEYSDLVNKGTENQKDYTYDYTITAASAGKQSMTLYGTGLFGGTKVYNYKIINKVYNLKDAKFASKNITVTITDKKDTEEVKAALKAAIAKNLIVNNKEINPDNITVNYPNGLKVQNGPLKVEITGYNETTGVKVYSGKLKADLKVTFKVKK